MVILVMLFIYFGECFGLFLRMCCIGVVWVIMEYEFCGNF